MKKHTKIYLNYFGLGEQDFFFCEYEWVVNKKEVRAVDINHIDARGMGGSKNKDHITNLMATSRDLHNKFGDIKSMKEKLKEIHLEFLTNNPY